MLHVHYLTSFPSPIKSFCWETEERANNFRYLFRLIPKPSLLKTYATMIVDSCFGKDGCRCWGKKRGDPGPVARPFQYRLLRETDVPIKRVKQ